MGLRSAANAEDSYRPAAGRGAAGFYLELSPSKRLFWTLACAHAGALACTLAVEPPITVGLLAAAVITSSLVYTTARHALLVIPSAIVALEFAGGETWRVRSRGGANTPARLDRCIFVHPELLVLTFHAAGGHRLSVVLLPGMAEAEALRRLRVQLWLFYR